MENLKAKCYLKMLLTQDIKMFYYEYRSFDGKTHCFNIIDTDQSIPKFLFTVEGEEIKYPKNFNVRKLKIGALRKNEI